MAGKVVRPFGLDAYQIEVLVDALEMRREYLVIAVKALGSDQTGQKVVRDLEATDALLRHLRRDSLPRRPA
jgi:hypothetical protein